jgi:ribonuclease III
LISKLIRKLLNRNRNYSKGLLKSIGELEDKLGYFFKDKGLLIQALKHRSYITSNSEERSRSNERLEFLGDSVLSFVVSKHLYKTFSEQPEGELSKMRSILVSGENLCSIARKLELGKYILVSEYEERSGGREKDSILEDCMESVIGAVYLDSGILKTQKLIRDIFLENCGTVLSEKKNSNYKSDLLELVQSYGIEPPTYEVAREDGPEHDKTFTVNVIIHGKIVADGKANSKKKAEQSASSNALNKINSDPDFFK